MSNVLAQRGRLSAYKLVGLQAVAAIVTSILFFVMWGALFGLSALAGGLIAVLPNFVFATLAFSHAGASASRKVVLSFFFGEAVKLLLTIALFALAFGVFNAEFLPLFFTYALSLVVPWTAPLYVKQN
ncbi:F0F1 ATP synthase subunit I [Shewanella sp. WXL01]|uniref:F0F1 ATP synthase subunit I n=1 Tax=Shewanella maritima TaxID=2520507 RepID=A0A411PHV1_9GAMM|nr:MULTISPECIES: ATP synthase subunit I [Shewanella]NKF51885.1 F0F1 ATP synthase subunit I [Shewanella sp. WXL01]QBF83034.1 F0F1 ATP synthase subunit I [Shewanella maritima]